MKDLLSLYVAPDLDVLNRAATAQHMATAEAVRIAGDRVFGPTIALYCVRVNSKHRHQAQLTQYHIATEAIFESVRGLGVRGKGFADLSSMGSF